MPTVSPPPRPAKTLEADHIVLLQQTSTQRKTTTTMASQNGQQRPHQVVGHKSLLQSDALYQYILDTSVLPREPECMKELRQITANDPMNIMSISVDEGQFLNMLLKLTRAKKTMEIGILAMDINRKCYEVGLPTIQKAGVAHKIDFREGPALPVLDQLLQDETNHGSFDFVFVDADKENYVNYHRRLLDLVKVGGLIAYDNTLWSGAVAAPPDAPLPGYLRHYLDFVLLLNQELAADPRIEICQLPVGDGVTLCRRIR
ncbi:caffeoyl-CoA O-methyltransferase [Musa troglodytarum]|nr:caffeoyl-CoA O-methyltransferase [Musa troglodytarum]URE27568.1 caffeoyl-CoA O-methyltransferase [Musa troglodytarum]